MQAAEAEQRMYDEAGKHGTELGELDARIAELEAELKYEERKYFEAMGVWHDGRDVGKLTTNLRQLLDIKKENEAEIAKLEATVDNLKAELAYKRVNNPYGCKGSKKKVKKQEKMDSMVENSSSPPKATTEPKLVVSSIKVRKRRRTRNEEEPGDEPMEMDQGGGKQC